MTKTVKLVKITHKLYAYNSNNLPAEYESKVAAMFSAGRGIVASLREKYAKCSFTDKITTWDRHDCDDDDFFYMFVVVPEADVAAAKTRIRSAASTSSYSRGWTVSIDCDTEDAGEVEYTMVSGKLRPGQLLARANKDVGPVIIGGVENYSYDYGKITDRRGNTEYGPRKHCLYNRTGMSTKLVLALTGDRFDAKDFKSKLPKDAKRWENDSGKISVYFTERVRANLMRIARSNPGVLSFYTKDDVKILVPDADKSDFVKTVYSIKDKKGKGAPV